MQVDLDTEEETSPNMTNLKTYQVKIFFSEQPYLTLDNEINFIHIQKLLRNT